MPAIKPYRFLSLLLLAGIMLPGCQYKRSSNTVTITPSTNTSTTEKPSLSGLDKSPMDMSYYPADYPKLKMSKNNTEPLIARVIYSRPQKGGRIIFGDVLKYGSPWRLGANEATEIEFFTDVTIDNQHIPKGRYVLYAIPYDDQWTFILNSDLFTWGLKIDSTKDVFRFNIPIRKTAFPFEVFTMMFEKTGKDMQLVVEWDAVQAILPIRY